MNKFEHSFLKELANKLEIDVTNLNKDQTVYAIINLGVIYPEEKKKKEVLLAYVPYLILISLKNRKNLNKRSLRPKKLLLQRKRRLLPR